MTGLLVSVRSAAEAQVALAGGADIIDVKEPSRGALGAADPCVWKEILDAVGGRVITSAVLGELSDDAAEQLAPQTAGFNYAKVGLAGCTSASNWPHRLHRIGQLLPSSVQLVPVAYADWQRADAPAPERVLENAATQSPMLVLDTFEKTGGSLLKVLNWTAIENLHKQALAKGVRLVLAGGLDATAIQRLLQLQPSFIGVRGAACQGGRADSIDFNRVRRLANQVRRANALSAQSTAITTS